MEEISWTDFLLKFNTIFRVFIRPILLFAKADCMTRCSVLYTCGNWVLQTQETRNTVEMACRSSNKNLQIKRWAECRSVITLSYFFTLSDGCYIGLSKADLFYFRFFIYKMYFFAGICLSSYNKKKKLCDQLMKITCCLTKQNSSKDIF